MDARHDSKREHVNETFKNTILGGLDNKQTGVIILVMQRLHPDDLSGRVQRLSDEWKTLSFPAIAEGEERIQIGPHQFHERHIGDVLHPEREPLEILERIRSQMSAEDFAAQYQQSPIPPGGFLIKRDQIQYCDELPRRTSSTIYAQSWDTAQKPGETNARSACLDILVQDHNFFIARALAGQWEYHDLEQQVILRANEQKPDVILIEDTGFGTALISTLKQRKLPVVAVTPEGDKKTRLLRQISKFTNRQVFLFNTAPGRSELEDELFSFPGGRRNDLVDALTQALGHNHVRALWTDKSVENYGNFLAGLALRGVGF
jgi:predicted phage terminase large subunit-like protein